MDKQGNKIEVDVVLYNERDNSFNRFTMRTMRSNITKPIEKANQHTATITYLLLILEKHREMISDNSYKKLKYTMIIDGKKYTPDADCVKKLLGLMDGDFTHDSMIKAVNYINSLEEKKTNVSAYYSQPIGRKIPMFDDAIYTRGPYQRVADLVFLRIAISGILVLFDKRPSDFTFPVEEDEIKTMISINENMYRPDRKYVEEFIYKNEHDLKGALDWINAVLYDEQPPVAESEEVCVVLQSPSKNKTLSADGEMHTRRKDVMPPHQDAQELTDKIVLDRILNHEDKSISSYDEYVEKVGHLSVIVENVPWRYRPNVVDINVKLGSLRG